MGRLGFLLPFSRFREELSRLIHGRVTVLSRNRLQCRFNLVGDNRVAWNGVITDVVHVANEVNLHRGVYPHLIDLKCYVDGRGWADRCDPDGVHRLLLIGRGPIVHPSIQGHLLTPICPRSLSFRPVLLPSTSKLTLSLHPSSKSAAQVSLDGREACSLKFGESVEVTKSPYPLLAINEDSEGADWAQAINHLLKWNQSFSPST
ncbi:NADH kinase pos5 [Massospora cicadina]|nr:NADH kinase pos5 [Massospora cicadina]